MIVLYLILAYSTLGWGETWAATLYPEDHYFETIGAMSFFAASAISLFAFMRAMKMSAITRIHRVKLLVYSVLAMLFFFGAGEELSWGQRMLLPPLSPGFAGEDIEQELKIQNLAIVENNSFLNADLIYTAFWMVFAVAIPFVSLVWKRFKLFAETFTPVVYWGIGVLFLLNQLFAWLGARMYASVYSYQPILFPQALQEVKESNYELLFVFLALLVLRDLHLLVFPTFELPGLNRVQATDRTIPNW